MDKNLTIPIICGPTGSGKTAAALKLAKDYPIEIISADSRQVIRNLDIGTAKPTADEQRIAPFHLIDVIDLGERYTAAHFIENAGEAIDGIVARQHIPIVVGGTGLYLHALTEGVVEISEEDMSIRERLEQELTELGTDAMHAKLEGIDPLEAARIHPHNKARIVRALEIFYLTGKTKSELTVSGSYKKSDHNYRYFCLQPDRIDLYARIDDRVDKMIAAGLMAEVKRLIADGLTEPLRAAGVIGYTEILGHLDGNCSEDDAITQMKQNSRRYAKRQMTWFRNQTDSEIFADSESLCAATAEALRDFGR